MGIICRPYFHGSRVIDPVPVCAGSLVPDLVLADHRNGIVMAPVGDEIAISRCRTVLLIVCVYPHADCQRKGIVSSVQGHSRAFVRNAFPDPVLCEIDAGDIFHPVHSHTQAHRILTTGKLAGHIHDMGRVLGRSGHRIGQDAAACRILTVPVPGDRNNIILLQVVPGNRGRAAEGTFADAGSCGQGNDIGMDIRLPVHTGGFYLFVPGNIGADPVGHLIDGHRRSGGNAFAFRHVYRHVDDRIACSGSQSIPDGFAQVTEAAAVYVSRSQVRCIRVGLFIRRSNIPCHDRYASGCCKIFCARDKGLAGVLQLVQCQGSGPAYAEFAAGPGYAQAYPRVHLGQVVPGLHRQIADTGIPPALYTALDIVFQVAGRRGDTRRDTAASGMDPGHICAPGNLDVTVVSTVFQTCTAGIGNVILLVGSTAVNQDCMDVILHHVQGKAEGRAAAGALSPGLIHHCNA